jgi:hypothetical protein
LALARCWCARAAVRSSEAVADRRRRDAIVPEREPPVTLTNDRVRFERAPFDHPSICVPVGYREIPPGALTRDTSTPGNDAAAADLFALVPAVGAGGNNAPLQTFAELLQGIGRDGSRAQSLQQSCIP